MKSRVLLLFIKINHPLYKTGFRIVGFHILMAKYKINEQAALLLPDRKV